MVSLRVLLGLGLAVNVLAGPVPRNVTNATTITTEITITTIETTVETIVANPFVEVLPPVMPVNNTASGLGTDVESIASSDSSSGSDSSSSSDSDSEIENLTIGDVIFGDIVFNITFISDSSSDSEAEGETAEMIIVPEGQDSGSDAVSDTDNEEVVCGGLSARETADVDYTSSSGSSSSSDSSSTSESSSSSDTDDDATNALRVRKSYDSESTATSDTETEDETSGRLLPRKNIVDRPGTSSESSSESDTVGHITGGFRIRKRVAGESDASSDSSTETDTDTYNTGRLSFSRFPQVNHANVPRDLYDYDFYSNATYDEEHAPGELHFVPDQYRTEYDTSSSDGDDDEEEEVLRIAIIGAGAAGASTAYYLRRYFNAGRTPITVFERNGHVGGRSTTVNVFDSPGYAVDVGASTFTQANRILTDVAGEFNLTVSRIPTLTSNRASSVGMTNRSIGLWDGQTLSYVSQGKKKLWKGEEGDFIYAEDFIRTLALVNNVTSKFFELYKGRHYPWFSLPGVLQDVGLENVISKRATEYFDEHLIQEPFKTDIMGFVTLASYSQSLRWVHGLVPSLSMMPFIGGKPEDGALHVEGGTWRIFDEMIKDSDVTLALNTTVHGIHRQANGSYILDYSSPTTPAGSYHHEQFDIVVLAAPHDGSIEFSPEPAYVPQLQNASTYVDVWETLFTTPLSLSPEYFNLSSDQQVPTSIITTAAAASGENYWYQLPHFFSITLLNDTVVNPATGSVERLYRFLSPLNIAVYPYIWDAMLRPSHASEADGKGQVGLDSVTWMKQFEWAAYPYYKPPTEWDPIRLDTNLWYTAGIEQVISTMEASAMMGRNVAKLIQWHLWNTTTKCIHDWPTPWQKDFEDRACYSDSETDLEGPDYNW